MGWLLRVILDRQWLSLAGFGIMMISPAVGMVLPPSRGRSWFMYGAAIIGAIVMLTGQSLARRAARQRH